jgi:hypothetical protein
MTDLEIKLAEERERLREEMKANNPGIESFSRLILWGEGFDAAAAIAREVVAEKDKQLLDMSAYTAEFNVYREQLVQMTKELAEKDVEIARLEARANRLGESYKLMAEDNAKLRERFREPRKVTDAQRETILEALRVWWSDADDTLGESDKRLMDRIVAVFESTDEPAAK